MHTESKTRRSVIWSIGDPQRGLIQFGEGPLGRPDVHQVTFDVDADDPTTQWPGLHPGPSSASAGYASKSIVIRFTLDEAPAGTYELSAHVYAGQHPSPHLDVDVNGRNGLYLVDPVRIDRSGIVGVSPIAGWATVRVPIDAADLALGLNQITLTSVDIDHADREELGAPHPVLARFWSGNLRYGGVDLRRLGADDLPEPELSLTPLPLFVGDEGRDLRELCDVVVTAPRGFEQGTLYVRIGDHESVHSLPAAQHGQVRVRFEVPAIDEAVPAEITADLDGTPVRLATTFRPCRRWTLHLISHVHLDVGYTDYQAKVGELHARNLDRVLDVLRTTPDYAYSIDGSWVVEQYQRARSPEAVAELVEAIKNGRMSVNTFSLLFMTGIAGLEECIRSGRWSAEFRREHGVDLTYANLTDVPSYSSALPTVLAAMGVRSFLGIQNHGRAATEDSDVLHMRSPFQWEGPDGARVVSFFADCYAQLRYLCGHPTTVAGSADSFSRLLRRYERDDYLPTDLPIVGIYSDNEDLGDGEAELVERWQRAYTYPRLQFSTVADYFAALEPIRDALPVVRGDGGSYWEDGLGAAAGPVATYRRAQTAMSAAEALAALVASVDPRIRPDFDDLDEGWEALQFGSEHTWTSMHALAHPHSHQTTDQLDWKRHRIASAHSISADAIRRALSQLGELVTTFGPSLVVTNMCSWTRTVGVDLELKPGSTLIGPDGAIPLDVLREVDGLHHVRLRVPDVPAFGYRVLTLVETMVDNVVHNAVEPGQLEARPVVQTRPAVLDGRIEEPGDTLRAGRYEVRFDHAAGRVVGLRHLERDRELLDPASPWSLGEVVYVAGGGTPEGHAAGERSSLDNFDRSLPLPELAVSTATTRIRDVRRLSDGHLITMYGHGPTLPEIEARLRLYDDDDRIDLDIGLLKESELAKESVYVAFPFALPDPTIRYDRQLGFVDPARDHLPGAANEWFTTQFVTGISAADCTVLWSSVDAPLFAVGDVVRSRWPREFTAGNGTVLSWIMNNHWFTNYPAHQSGRMRFRYSFTPTASWDPAAAARFGREARAADTSAQVGWLDKMDTGSRPLPSGVGTLLKTEAPEHILVEVFAARRAQGLLLRIQEVAGRSGVATITHPFPGGRVVRCSALEDDIDVLGTDKDVRIELSPYELITLRFEGDITRSEVIDGS